MRGGRSRRRVAAAVAGAAVAAAAALVAVGGGGSPPAATKARSPSGHGVDATLPEPADPAFRVPRPIRLRTSPFESTWAPVRRTVLVRAHPARRAPPVGRLGARTPEGTTNIVLALDRDAGARGALWIRVRLPGRGSDASGWVPRTALGGYGVVRTRLVVDESDLTATLLRNGRVVFRAPVGIGASAYPTPTGEFYVRNKLDSYRSPFYGPLAFGTSARSSLSEWPAGGFVGIHGTSRPDLIPGRVSHGCIRLRNPDILRLARLMPIGTPLTIRG
jgi:L,D-transpeptidase catalytic domain